MVEPARDMITNTFILDEMVPELPVVLNAIIEGHCVHW